MANTDSDPKITEELVGILATMPIKSTYTISIPVTPSGKVTALAQQWFHIRIERTLYYFRGDYFAEGFLSESDDPDAPRGNPTPAELLELHIKIEDPSGFEHTDREDNTAYNSFTKKYYGTTDDYTRHRFVASATAQMPPEWIPRVISTRELVIER